MGGAFQKHPSYAGGCKCVESKASKLGRRAEISSKWSKLGKEGGATQNDPSYAGNKEQIKNIQAGGRNQIKNIQVRERQIKNIQGKRTNEGEGEKK